MIDSFSGEYEFLSNFYPCEVRYGDNTYPTAEHAFQASKTLDEAERQKVHQASTPGMAKQAGRKVTLRRNWEKVKIRKMTFIVREKFKNQDLRDKLISTGDQELVEGNNWNDTFWGVCKGKGQNQLGKILVQIREEIKMDEWNKIVEKIFDINTHDTRYGGGVSALYADMLKHKYKDKDREQLGSAADKFIDETLNWHEEHRHNFQIHPSFETRILEIMND